MRWRHHVRHVLALAPATRCGSVPIHLGTGRLAKWLLAHAGDDGEVTLDQSQEALARSLGTSRQTLNRSLHRVERLGLIEMAGHTIRILDAGALRDRALD